MTAGQLEVLNVAAGDLKFTFDKESEKERKEAQAMITDLLQQGYALLLQTEDGTYERATAFDPERDVYLVGRRKEDKVGKPAARRVYRRTARATAVAPSSGG